jgi:outer membrane protein assembly factor BamB
MTRFAPILPAIIAILWALPVSAENWPGFRGPTRQGVSTETGLPLKWSETENIVWKTPIPGLGWSSPIVWGDRIFLTTTLNMDTSCHVLCIDRNTGKVLWNKEVFQQVVRRRERMNSGATPTPVTDGQLVYAVFCDGSIVALDFDGNVAWLNRDVKYYSRHGLGASPILYQDLLIMPVDHSTTDMSQERLGWQLPWDQSYILALDKKTGKERWRGQRGMSRIGHSTPNIMTVDGKPQLISAAGDVVQGYDPATGQRLWSVTSLGEPCVPAIVIGDDLVYSAPGLGGPASPAIRAVRPGHAGREAQVVWEQFEQMPMLPSFIYAKPHLFSLKEAGFAMCLDAQTGQIVWKQRLDGRYSASPILAEGRLYLMSDHGECTIIEAGPEFKEIARNSLGENIRIQASIAASQGRLFVRTQDALYSIGK